MGGSYLFATPSFFSGVARLVDLGGIFDDYNLHRTPSEADAAGLRADWAGVATDLDVGMTAEAENQASRAREQ